MRRRDFIVGNSALLTACTNDDIAPPRVVVKPIEEKKKKPKPKPTLAAPDDHDGHPEHGAGDPTAGHAGHHTVDRELLAATRACVEKGLLCQAHCHILLADGDASMGECTKAVTDMLAVTQALSALTAAASPSMRAQAGVAREVCSRCQEACQVHAAVHPACRECAEACGDALANYNRLLG